MNGFDGGFDLLLDGAAEPRLSFVVVGIVTRSDDPDGLGRVKVRFPWLSGSNESHWARVATPMAGREIGLFLLPEAGDEVLVAFAHGSADQPYVLGSLWNGKARPPAAAGDGDGDGSLRLLRTKSFEIVIDDRRQRLWIADRDGESAGKNALTLDAAEGRISLTCAGDVTLEARGRLVLKGDAGVAIESASGPVTVKAAASLELEAAGDAGLKGLVTNVRGNPINLN